MFAMNNVPIATLAIPISVLVGMPVGVIPIVVGVHCSPSMGVHNRSTMIVNYYSVGVRFQGRCDQNSEQRDAQY
jgi:hypothetical protein